MQYCLFIDESGDLGDKQGGSQYIILSALLVKDYTPLDRIIKNMRRNKFKKELRKAQEIKANNSSHELITYMLKKLSEVPNIKVLHAFLEKKKLRSKYLKKEKNKLYNFIAGKLAANINIQGGVVEVRIDRSKGKQILQNDFNNYFEKKLREGSAILKVKIYHSYSHSWSGLQFADILAWSAYQKICLNNSEFADIVPDQEIYSI
ncbi:MAG: DUF3800 domain-containing protein [Candidatus Woesearchaeota archaeon]